MAHQVLILSAVVLICLPALLEAIKACPPPFELVHDSCYYFVDSVSLKRKSWFEAGKDCKELDSTLINIETPEESLHLNIKILNKYKDSEYWTSGNDLEVRRIFRWTSGQPFTFTKWCKGEPDNKSGVERCVRLLHKDYSTCWQDYPCNQQLDYICEMTPITLL